MRRESSSGRTAASAFPGRPRGGFTVVEVLVSVVLLTAGVLGLSAVVRTAGKGLAMDRAHAQAAATAEELMERALACGFSEDRGELVGDEAALSWNKDASGLVEARLVVQRRVGESVVLYRLVRWVVAS